MRSRARPGRVCGRWWTAAAVWALSLGASARGARAQGFGLNEIGTCASGRGFAATGTPCEDASTLFWNPAAATSLRGLSVYAGASAISTKGSFTEDSTGRASHADVPLVIPPFLGVGWTPDSRRYALGVAAYAPYGFVSQWGSDFAGRFNARKGALASVYVQPTIAVDLVPGVLSIGGGPTIGWARLELRQSIDLAAQRVPGSPVTFAQLGVAPNTEFAQARLQGSATGFGFNVGAHARITESVSVGARYLSRVRLGFEGADATFAQVSTGLQIYPQSPLRAALPASTPANAIVPLDQVLATQFQPGGPLAPGQPVGTTLDLPAQLQIGVGFTALARTTISADYAWLRWRSFRELTMDFGAASPLTRTIYEDFEDVRSVRVGLEHRFAGGTLGGLLGDVAGRLGFAHSPTPAPPESVTPLLPDMDRYELTAGLGVPFGRAITLDVAYLRVETAGRRGRVGDRTSRSLTAAQLNTGWYALGANVVSLSLKAQF